MLRLQERDERLMVDLFLQRTMSRDQIIALRYFGSVPRCNNRLKKLLDHKYLRRYEHASRGSGSQALYAVAQKAAAIVARSLDLELLEVKMQARRDTPPLALEHTVGLVDLRIRFERDAARLGLERFAWVPEPLCRHEYSVRNAKGVWERQVLKPDALVRWVSDGQNRFCFVELDLGHVSYKAFANKVTSYRRYLDLGVFTEVYGPGLFKVLLITTGQRRIAHLRKAAAGPDRPAFIFDILSRIDQLGPFGAMEKGADGASRGGETR